MTKIHITCSHFDYTWKEVISNHHEHRFAYLVLISLVDKLPHQIVKCEEHFSEKFFFDEISTDTVILFRVKITMRPETNNTLVGCRIKFYAVGSGYDNPILEDFHGTTAGSSSSGNGRIELETANYETSTGLNYLNEDIDITVNNQIIIIFLARL